MSPSAGEFICDRPFTINALAAGAKIDPPDTIALRNVPTPALLTVSGYVAPPPLREYPSFQVPVGVAAVAGKFSAKKSIVCEAAVSHAVPRHLIRGDICTVTPLVAAVVFVAINPSVEVVVMLSRVTVAVVTEGFAV